MREKMNSYEEKSLLIFNRILGALQRDGHICNFSVESRSINFPGSKNPAGDIMIGFTSEFFFLRVESYLYNGRSRTFKKATGDFNFEKIIPRILSIARERQ